MVSVETGIPQALRDIADDDPEAASIRLKDLDSTDALVLRAYAEVIRTHFHAARGPARRAVASSSGGREGDVASALAVHALVLAFIGPEERTTLQDLSTAVTLADDAATAVPTKSPWLRYLLAEGAMSAGDITRAIALSAPDPRPSEPVLRTLLSQVHARALGFGGQLDEAQAEVEVMIGLAQEHGLRGAESLGHGLAAYLAAQRGERALLRSCARAALALAHAPASNYLHTGAHVLVSFALAADEQYTLAAATLLTGGGPDLARLQFVDRAYGYELLAGAALQSGDLLASRHWLARAQANPSEGMAAAAVARTEAMVRAAEGELPAGALAALRAVHGADSMGGSLDAARARVLHGSALSRIGSRQKALEELERSQVGGRGRHALRIRAQAVREMRRLGRRVPPPGRDGQALSPREKQVALLVADGLSNRQVARLLSMSERTVQSHLVTILRRLGLSSRAGLPQALQVPTAAPVAVTLTDRQQAVASLVAKGLSNAAIATELGVSPKTVEKHLGDAFSRCGVASRTALAAHWQASQC